MSIILHLWYNTEKKMKKTKMNPYTYKRRAAKAQGPIDESFGRSKVSMVIVVALLVLVGACLITAILMQSNFTGNDAQVVAHKAPQTQVLGAEVNK